MKKELVAAFIEQTVESVEEKAPHLTEYVYTRPVKAGEDGLFSHKIIIGTNIGQNKKKIKQIKERIAELEKLIPETESGVKIIEKNMEKTHTGGKKFANEAYDRTRAKLQNYKNELAELRDQLKQLGK